jgi:hypothetical protein
MWYNFSLSSLIMRIWCLITWYVSIYDIHLVKKNCKDEVEEINKDLEKGEI